MIRHGFVRVATAVPLLRVADCDGNADRIIGLLKQAEVERVAVVVFPELAVTGYTCGDLFHQLALQRGAWQALLGIAEFTRSGFSGLAVVGLPFAHHDQLFNAAAVLHHGQILGIVPKSYLPNYKEFYEDRWFTPAGGATRFSVIQRPNIGPFSFGTHLLFRCRSYPELTIGVEICEDLWTPVPPSCLQALAGATLLLNLSASNETIGKAGYRRQLVMNQSARCLAAYAYAGCGVSESTTDLVFGGHCLIAENGNLLAEAERFRRDEVLTIADVDLDRLLIERQRTNSFQENRRAFAPEHTTFAIIDWSSHSAEPADLRRAIDPHPFVPAVQEHLRERCDEIFHIQVSGLAKRLEHIGKPAVSIGISGGLDSTLALLVACKTADAIAMPRSRILAFTMPGFGTTGRTRTNAIALMGQLGVTASEVDIRAMCLAEMKALRHKPFGIDLDGLDVDGLTTKLRNLPPEKCNDLVFENVQARMRTSILMNAGFVIGTGDVSELALGWCTYNADHMSMYNPNVSIPKTLVKFLVAWAAENEFAGDVRATLTDIVATVISPELLPAGNAGQLPQETEQVIGPYELHDFFLFHFLRYGTPPEKILFLAQHAAFDRKYTEAEIRRWLSLFIRRFFGNQFKRSCLPDGPKVGSISLSPRGDWRMPSDAAAAMWVEWAKKGNAFPMNGT
jgi:NAD+ synthase (glutamine-hydrolysing)